MFTKGYSWWLVLSAGVLWVAAAGCVSPRAKPASMRAYNRAAEQFAASNYQGATMLLQDFLANYPDSSLAPIARMYLADAYRQLALYRNALKAYDAFLVGKPYPPLVPMAMYYKARCLEKLDRRDDAASVYGQIAKDFAGAGSEQAEWVTLAKERLSLLAVPEAGNATEK